MEEIRFISSEENSSGFFIKSNIISDASPPQKTCPSTTNVGTPNTPFSIALDVLVRNIFLRYFYFVSTGFVARGGLLLLSGSLFPLSGPGVFLFF